MKYHYTCPTSASSHNSPIPFSRQPGVSSQCWEDTGCHRACSLGLVCHWVSEFPEGQCPADTRCIRHVTFHPRQTLSLVVHISSSARGTSSSLEHSIGSDEFEGDTYISVNSLYPTDTQTLSLFVLLALAYIHATECQT